MGRRGKAHRGTRSEAAQARRAAGRAHAPEAGQPGPSRAPHLAQGLRLPPAEEPAAEEEAAPAAEEAAPAAEEEAPIGLAEAARRNEAEAARRAEVAAEAGQQVRDIVRETARAPRDDEGHTAAERANLRHRVCLELSEEEDLGVNGVTLTSPESVTPPGTPEAYKTDLCGPELPASKRWRLR